MSTILVTGGAGFIGSHTVTVLMELGHEVIIVDDLSNSSMAAVRRIREIVGKDFTFFQTNVADVEALERVFRQQPIDAVIHFAGLKAVGESVEKPLLYYRNNLESTLALCELMEKFDVKNIVFSSSATVYGAPDEVPIPESAKLNPTNPYGRTKLMIEEILSDQAAAGGDWSVVLLRYFNPIGAHPSGLLGEDPRGIPNNLLPYISQVAAGRLPHVAVFGDDYDTKDGTGVRDYIHVMDLAEGHVAALDYALANTGTAQINLGTGKGTSVLELIRTFENVTGCTIPYEIGMRRAGDIAVSYADPSLAKTVLGWEATRDVAEMCKDAWVFQQKNPEGYR